MAHYICITGTVTNKSATFRLHQANGFKLTHSPVSVVPGVTVPLGSRVATVRRRMSPACPLRARMEAPAARPLRPATSVTAFRVRHSEMARNTTYKLMEQWKQ